MSGSVTSPCIDICRIDPENGLCAGCLRTLEEIAGWGGYSEAQKRAVLDKLAQRRGAVNGAPPDSVPRSS